MAVAGVVDVRVNPADTSQRVELYGNGRIDVENTAPVTDSVQYYDRPDQPVVVAIWVIEWGATTSGYVLDNLGGFTTFGGAPNIATSKPDWADGPDMIVPGVPYWSFPIYVDWSWDPNNPGRGVVLDGYGTLHAFGGAPTPPRSLNRWGSAGIARKLVMDWTPGSIKAYTLDYTGGIHPDYAAVSVAGLHTYWGGPDVARDLAITKWTAPVKGYTLDLYGGVHQFTGTEPASGGPYAPGADRARRLVVLNADDPLRLWQVWGGGQEFEWTASTPPTVTAGGVVTISPAATVTGTTRPMLAWDYSDAQQDSQAAWELYVFTEAFAASHTMTDPAVHAASSLVAESGVDRSVRGIASPVDLPNGSYRLYVRAKDTADQWSAWDSHSWAQDVPVPTTPTGLTATASDATFSVALSVTATTGENADLVRFDASDDGGSTWQSVDGADAVPLAATTTATDRFPPLGVERTYRAVAYAVDPRVASVPSAADTATVDRLTYLLHARDDAALGGEVRAAGPFEWSRPVAAGVFEGLGAKFPTVVTDGTPRARRLTLRITTRDRGQWETVKALAESNSVLVLRDPFGDVAYCSLVGDWSQRLLEAAPLAGEATPLRHMHTTELPLVEVRPPHLAA